MTPGILRWLLDLGKFVYFYIEPLKMEVTCCFETSGSIYPATKRRIPDGWPNRTPSCEQHPSGKREKLQIKGEKRMMRTIFALQRVEIGDGRSKLLNLLEPEFYI